MKIKYFKLENFAGIKYGINNSVFELTDIPSGIVKLQGDNGCGKSTTLHTLHIFSDDKSFLIKEEDGSFTPASKELIVEHNNNEYHIIHQYNAKGSKKSFISKNNEELNANGNVTTFEDVVLKEFGIIDNSVSNSVTGVSEVHFIDLTSTKRKEEIASLLPNISEYEKQYKSANDALNTAKKHQQMVSKLITEHGSEETMLESIKQIQEKINPITAEIEKLDLKILEASNNRAVKESKIFDTNNQIQEIELYLNTNLNQYSNNNRIIETLNEVPKELDISVLNAKKDVAINLVNQKKDEINKIQSEINTMNIEWSNYNKTLNHNNQIEENRNKIQNQINILDEEIKVASNELSAILQIENKPYFNQDTLDHIQRVGVSIKQELEALKRGYTFSIDEKNELDLYEDIESINNKVSLFQSKQNELNKLQAYISLFSNLSNNTNNKELESIQLTDGCSFNKCAIQYKTLLNIYQENANKLKTMLDNNLEKYNQYCVFQNIANQFKYTYDDRFKLATKLSISEESFNVKNLYNTLQVLRDKKKEIENYFNIANQIPEKKRYIESKEQYKQQLLSNLNSMQIMHQNELTFSLNDISDKQVYLSNISNELQSLEKNVVNINNEIETVIQYSNLNKMKEFNLDYDNRKNKRNDLNNNVLELKNELNQLNEYIVSLNSIKQEKNIVISQFRKEIEDINSKLAIIKDHIASKNKLDLEIEERQMVISALHPTKGIPNLLVKQYLTKIENTCNEILEKTFDGSYKIYLENLEKDFFVRVYEKSTNRYIADVKNASSGQQAIIKLVLSIALIKCSVGDRIYLTLDEIDSVLSKDNLSMVETLLNTVLNKFSIEQVFIVTHNSSISVCDMQVDFDRIEQRYDIKRLGD